MVSLNKVSVLLDTNFVLSCYRFGIRLEEIDSLLDEAHEICVPENVLEELKRLPLKGKEREARSIMLAVIARYPVLPLQGRVDESLICYAREHDCVVCTNDRQLRKRLRTLGRRSLFVRSRSHLDIE